MGSMYIECALGMFWGTSSNSDGCMERVRGKKSRTMPWCAVASKVCVRTAPCRAPPPRRCPLPACQAACLRVGSVTSALVLGGRRLLPLPVAPLACRSLRPAALRRCGPSDGHGPGNINGGAAGVLLRERAVARRRQTGPTGLEAGGDAAATGLPTRGPRARELVARVCGAMSNRHASRQRAASSGAFRRTAVPPYRCMSRSSCRVQSDDNDLTLSPVDPERLSLLPGRGVS